VEERWREIEARLEPPLLIFALLTIPAIALEYGAQDQPGHAIGIVLNWMIWLAFVAGGRDHAACRARSGALAARSPLDLAIVAPPFLPAPLQAARVFRLLGLLGLLKAGCSRDVSSPPKAYATPQCSR
jgi:hypothetical protein